MFVSESYVTSLILCITTMLCWGSNMNACKNLPYPVAYYNLDFVIWCFLWMIILCAIFGLGYFPPDHEQSILTNFEEVLTQPVSVWIIQILGPFFAGVTNIGTQIVQFATIDAVGLSSGIPLLFGIAMVIGAVLTYIVSRSGKFALILSGVLVDFVGVIFNTFAYSYMKPSKPSSKESKSKHTPVAKNDEEKKESANSPVKATVAATPVENKEAANETNDKENKGTTEAPTPAENPKADIQDNMAASTSVTSISPVATNVPAPKSQPAPEPTTITIETAPPKKSVSTVKLVILCVLGAICNSCWGPFSAFASQGEIPLSAYGSMFLVTLGQVIFVFPLNLILMKCPLSGKKSNWKNWIKAPMKYRWPAIWSSFLFSFGCICYASSGSYLGYATSYALSRGIMLVAALWGIFYYKEFKNASALSWTLETCTLLCYIIGTLLICFSSE